MRTADDIRNHDLMKVYKIAKSRGYKVYSWETSGNNQEIKQIIIENQLGKIGSCSTHFSGIRFSTIHKPAESLGNGFGALGNAEKKGSFNEPDEIEVCFIHAPNWAARYSGIEKYKNFEEYRNHGSNKILKYHEI